MCNPFEKTLIIIFLRRAAQLYVSVPASSAAVERVFSEAGIILTKQRDVWMQGNLRL